MLPEQTGWLRSTPKANAHYFDEDGHSACHQWLKTTLDTPALDAPRCPACLDALRLLEVR